MDRWKRKIPKSGRCNRCDDPLYLHRYSYVKDDREYCIDCYRERHLWLGKALKKMDDGKVVLVDMDRDFD